MLTAAFRLLILFFGCKLVSSRTQADEHRTHKADIRLLKGAFLGKIEFVQEALAHTNTGNVNAILTAEIGEHFLKIGKAGVDFPVAPALHVAISGGTRKHLQVVHLLLMKGADPNLVYSSASYPSFPAIYYALGAFTAPTSGQAAIVQKLLTTYSEKFKFAALRRYVLRTGIPPPLHAAVLHNFFDGAFLFSTCDICNIDERDAQGLTALHVAAWLGNLHMVLLMLHNGASADALDPFQRTFFHVLASRGMFSIVRSLLFDDVSPLSPAMKLRLLTLVDDAGHTALDIALMPPAQMRVVRDIISYMKLHDMVVPPIEYDLSVQGCGSSFDVDVIYDQECSGGKVEIYVDPLESDVDALGSRKLNMINDEHESRWALGETFFRRSNIKPKIWNTIKNRSWTLLTEADFRKLFYYSQRPLKLVGNFTSSMNIWKYLDRKSFLGRYGSRKITTTNMFGEGCIKSYPSDSEILCATTLGEYFDNSRGYDKSKMDEHQVCDGDMKQSPIDFLNVQYLVGVMTLSSEEIIRDFSFPDKYFSTCGFSKLLNESMHLRLMSSASAITRFHSESSFWNVLLVGAERRWYLISPGVALNISSTPNSRYKANDNMTDWVENVFPELRQNRLAVEVVQRTGDVIFIPYSWSFVTSGRGDLIDLSHNFCVIPQYPTVFGQVPVGVRMYGDLGASHH